MTPAIKLAKKKKIPFDVHQYDHDPNNTAYGSEAARMLGLDENRVFKTLVLELDGRELAVAVIPVSRTLSMKQFAKSCNARKAVLAEQNQAQRATGYLVGGISPLAQKKPLKTIIDNSATLFPTIYVSAGRRGLEIELSAEDLSKLTNAVFTTISQSSQPPAV